MLSFLTETTELELTETIGEMRQSGVVMAFDPQTQTSCHCLVHVHEGSPPRLTRWVCQGPTTEEAARAMTLEIEAAVAADDERISMGQNIN